MATTTALLTIEEYLNTEYRPDCDFVDGEIEERNVGQFDHNRIQALLIAFFIGQEKSWNIVVVPEQRTQVSSTRVRIPDICLMHANSPREQITETPPLLCVKILSPDDRISRTTQVLDDFARMGVSHLWIIDPRERVGYVYHSPGSLNIVTDRLTIPESPIYLNLPALFAALDPLPESGQPS